MGLGFVMENHFSEVQTYKQGNKNNRQET